MSDFTETYLDVLELELAGWIERVELPDGSGDVGYVLTEDGAALLRAVGGIVDIPDEG